MEIKTGDSYACRFRIDTVLDDTGQPANPQDNKPSKIGTYESLGIIVKRDTEAKLVKVLDETTRREFIIPFDNIWDIDTIEWVN